MRIYILRRTLGDAERVRAQIRARGADRVVGLAAGGRVDEEALRRSGALERVEALPNGIDTTLTREFDDNGANLSGGEQQKIAVARAFAKKSAILLLDEPSSALDPVAEYQLMQNFVAHCRDESEGGKISVFISHRMSSSTVADRVVRLEGGRIAEEGTHEELMKRQGGYAAMFDKQAEHYLWTEDSESLNAE